MVILVIIIIIIIIIIIPLRTDESWADAQHFDLQDNYGEVLPAFLQNSPHTSSGPGRMLVDHTVVEDLDESDSDVLSTSCSCSRTPPLELDRIMPWMVTR